MNIMVRRMDEDTCPVCKGKMAIGNKFCSIGCYKKSQSKEDEVIEDDVPERPEWR